MLSETEARELLNRAAATIDVPPPAPLDPSAPLTSPVRRRWAAPAVAAVAVLAAVVVGILVTGEQREAASPVPVIASPAAPTPDIVDPAAVELAEELLAFAAGDLDDFPGGADVRLYTEGLLWNELTGAQADKPSSYSLCSGLGPPQCTASYLSALRVTGAHSVVTQLPSCYDRQRLIGPGPGGGTSTAFIISETEGACAGAIELRYDGPGTLVAVNVVSTTPDPERDAREVADRFIAFARGRIDGPPVDTPVGLYQDQVLVRTLSPADAGTRASYDDCGSGPCAFSAVDRIRDVAEVPALRTSPDVPACLAARGDELTAAQTGGAHSVLINDVDAPCAWGVQLWVNDVGQIVALDLRTRRTG